MATPKRTRLRFAFAKLPFSESQPRDQQSEAKAKLEAARKAKRDADAIIAAGTGTIIPDQPYIELKNVPVVTPNVRLAAATCIADAQISLLRRRAMCWLEIQG